MRMISKVEGPSHLLRLLDSYRGETLGGMPGSLADSVTGSPWVPQGSGLYQSGAYVLELFDRGVAPSRSSWEARPGSVSVNITVGEAVLESGGETKPRMPGAPAPGVRTGEKPTGSGALSGASGGGIAGGLSEPGGFMDTLRRVPRAVWIGAGALVVLAIVAAAGRSG